VNSKGETVYIVPATDDEMLNQTNALISKALRTLIMRHIPGDIVDEAMALCIATVRDKDAKDPDAARRAVFDAFASIGVMADQLAAYLGHTGQALTPAELAELRAVFAAIRDGEATWQEVIEHKQGAAEGETESPKAGKVADVIQKAKDKVAAKKTNGGAAAPPASAPAASPAPTAAPNADDDGR